MEKKHTGLEEQEAPLKNTDKAYVQVGTDGAAIMPDTTEPAATEDTRHTDEKPEEGTLRDR